MARGGVGRIIDDEDTNLLFILIKLMDVKIDDEKVTARRQTSFWLELFDQINQFGSETYRH